MGFIIDLYINKFVFRLILDLNNGRILWSLVFTACHFIFKCGSNVRYSSIVKP